MCNCILRNATWRMRYRSHCYLRVEACTAVETADQADERERRDRDRAARKRDDKTAYLAGKLNPFTVADHFFRHRVVELFMRVSCALFKGASR